MTKELNEGLTEVEQWWKDHVRYCIRAYYIAPEFLEGKFDIPQESHQEKNSKS